MILRFIDMDKYEDLSYKVPKIYCFCSFCRGYEKIKTVKHYKVFGENNREYYLNIDTMSNKLEFMGEALIKEKQNG